MGNKAGRWEQTKTPGVYVQRDRYGKPRSKAAFRDARGVVTSKTFPRIGLAQDYLADIRIRRATNTLPDVSKGAGPCPTSGTMSQRPIVASAPRSRRTNIGGATTCSPPSASVGGIPFAAPTSRRSTPTWKPEGEEDRGYPEDSRQHRECPHLPPAPRRPAGSLRCWIPGSACSAPVEATDNCNTERGESRRSMQASQSESDMANSLLLGRV
jgi:hypothetical protein